MMKRQTRNHPGLVWEGDNIHTQFTDINRMALDDKYGKVGAPLSKRRNGIGPAGRDAQPGLFGNPSLDKMESLVSKLATPKNIILAVTIAGAIMYYRKR